MNLGIIGGADGPTAIFLTGSAAWIPALGAILIILVAALVIWHKKDK